MKVHKSTVRTLFPIDGRGACCLAACGAPAAPSPTTGGDEEAAPAAEAHQQSAARPVLAVRCSPTNRPMPANAR